MSLHTIFISYQYEFIVRQIKLIFIVLNCNKWNKYYKNICIIINTTLDSYVLSIRLKTIYFN